MAEPDVRLIASDLDGTLLGGDGRLTERTVAAVRAAAEAGVVVVAATGRSHRTAEQRLRPAEVIRTAVCSNGASVYDLAERRIVLRRPIDDAVATGLLAALREVHPEVSFGWETPHGFGWEHRFFDQTPASVQDGLVSGRRAGELHDSIDDVAPVALTKLLVGHPRLQGNDWLDAVAPLIPARAKASTSGAPFVEVTGDGVDKGSTLALVCAELGVDRSQVLAFGDQSNDVTMLEWAGRSAAPANAHPSAAAAADEVIGHHADDGVAEVIERLLA